MHSSRLSTIKTTLPRPLEEKSNLALKYLLSQIELNTPSSIEGLTDMLCNYPYKILIAVCQKEPALEKFCRTNSILQKKMASKLQQKDQPSMDIQSMDGKEIYQVFDFYLAASFMNDFKSTFTTSDRVTTLNFACELGLNDALLFYCMTQIKVLKNEKVSANQHEEALANILLNVKRLTNLYWAMGYIQAGCILSELTAHFKEMADKDRAQTFLEQSVKEFLCAYELRENVFSNRLIDNYTKGAGMLSFISNKNLPFKTWEDAFSTFREWTGDAFIVLQKQAKDEIHKLSAVSNEKKLSL